MWHATYVPGRREETGPSRRSEGELARLAELVDNLDQCVLIVEVGDLDDPESYLVSYVNREAQEFAGVDPAVIVGRPLREATWLSIPTLESAVADAATRRVSIELDSLRADLPRADVHVVTARVFPVGDAVAVSFRAAGRRDPATELLRHRALHDPLTGLPNRLLLDDRIGQALRESRRSGEAVALLATDLNNFREVNETLGHRAGDRLLVELARRLEEQLRESDTICRVGADEFAILLTTGASEEGTRTVAEKVLGLLSRPVRVEELQLHVNPAVGWARATPEITDGGELLRRAEVALYEAKRLRRALIAYSPEMDSFSVHRLQLLGQLRNAMARDELVLHYQPVVDLRSREIVWVEALLRWQHPQHGVISPGTFVHLAEVGGLSLELVEWVTSRAARDAHQWRSRSLDVGVSVNVPVDAVTDPAMPELLCGLLGREGHPPDRFGVELTESQVMEDPLAAITGLQHLRTAGVTTSVDDFGTGYSSFTYLKQLPIDEVKIDGSFVKGMRSDAADRTIVRSLVELGHRLGLRVVAEGVEDEKVLRSVTDVGCDRAQGFAVARPLPVGELTEWLAAVL